MNVNNFVHLADAYVHRLDPFLVQFTGDFGLRWYGLSYAAGFLIAWLILHWFVKTGRTTMTKQNLGDFMLYVILGVLIGGRCGHALFYHFGEPFITFTNQFPYWEILAINRGGMSAHGGIVGFIVAAIIFARVKKLSALHVIDLGAFTCLPGLCLGRIANFINGELWGKALPASMQNDPPGWSVKYPTELLENETLLQSHPDTITQLMTMIEPGEGFVGRVVRAAYNGNEQVIETIRPILTAFYPSQLLQALSDGPILMGLLIVIWLRPRKPGVIGAWFLLGYGVLRIATEVVRQPDEGVAVWLGLSRGQWLSVLMVVAGAISIVICSKRDAPKLGGLARRRHFSE